MNLQVNRITYPVTTLGPGRRMALWVQGCSRHCSGCASSDTWNPSLGKAADVEELAEIIAKAVRENELDGLSITGGEPAEQASSVVLLMDTVRALVKDSFNILIFTGFAREELERQSPALLEKADVLVCGPYDRVLPRLNCLIASENQELVIVNEDVRQVFESYALDSRRALQFDVNDFGIQLIGMPVAGDLDLFEEKLAKRGVTLGGVSWRN